MRLEFSSLSPQVGTIVFVLAFFVVLPKFSHS